VDLYGAPGAFSQMLLAEAPQPARGFGMAPVFEGTSKGAVWYPELMQSWNFDPVWGQDGTGSLLSRDNVKHLVEVVSASCKSGKADLVVADGGFKIHKDAEGHHLENIQELLSHQIAVSELLAVLSTLREGGNFVMKLFDSFSHMSASIVYLVHLLFDHLHILKPFKSRSVNSERYLVAKSLRSRDSKAFARALALLTRAHEMCLADDERVPLTLVPLEVMEADVKFLECLRKANQTVAEHQAAAIKHVMDAVDKALAAGWVNSRVVARGNRGSASRRSSINADRPNGGRQSNGSRRQSTSKDDASARDARRGAWGHDLHQPSAVAEAGPAGNGENRRGSVGERPPGDRRRSQGRRSSIGERGGAKAYYCKARHAEFKQRMQQLLNAEGSGGEN